MATDVATREAERLLNEAEGRIGTATSQLLLSIRGVTDAAVAQEAALAELTAARNAIKAMRARLKPPA
jgi:hypothetical protein